MTIKMDARNPEGVGVFHQIFGSRVQYAKKKLDPIGSKVVRK